MKAFSLLVLNQNGKPIPAIEVDAGTFDLAAVAPGLIKQPETGLLDILNDWETAEKRLIDIAEQINGGRLTATAMPQPKSDDYDYLVKHPSKMIFAGMNYYDHLEKDVGVFDFKKDPVDPLFFLKHQGAHARPGHAISYPQQTNKFDWEIELVVIVGKRGHRVKAAEAMNIVAGYAIGLDLSARDWQFCERHLRKFDLFGGKAFDDSSPVGPKFVPARFVDPADLPLKLWVNGELKQSSSTRQMVWSIGEQIEFITQHMALLPGDMIFTGSPAGVGMPSNTFLKRGDVIEAEIGGLGRLTTPISER